MAMEPLGGMSKYKEFSRSSPTFGMTAAQKKRQAEQRAIQQDAEMCESLTRRGSTLVQIANVMVEQNEQMLAGLRAISSARVNSTGPPEKVDFISRNVAAVGADRSGIGRKEQALIARAEVMAAATTHLKGEVGKPAPSYRPRALQQQPPPPADSSAVLVAKAQEEISRGLDISAYEALTRRPQRTARRSVPHHLPPLR